MKTRESVLALAVLAALLPLPGAASAASSKEIIATKDAPAALGP